MFTIQSKDQLFKPLAELTPLWITPNGLAVFRLFMVIPIGFFAYTQQWIPTAFLLIAAYFTDILDGVLARHRHQVTKAGAVLDPIADKVIFLVLFWILGWRVIDPRIFGLLAILELLFVLAGPIFSLLPKKSMIDRKFGANVFGKLKTFFEVIGLLLLIAAYAHWPFTLLSAQVAFAAAVIFSLASFARHLLSRHNID